MHRYEVVMNLIETWELRVAVEAENERHAETIGRKKLSAVDDPREEEMAECIDCKLEPVSINHWEYWPLTDENKRELDNVCFETIKKDFLQIVLDTIEDGVFTAPSLKEYVESVVHGMVTCKHDTTLECGDDVEEQATVYLLDRFRKEADDGVRKS